MDDRTGGQRVQLTLNVVSAVGALSAAGAGLVRRAASDVGHGLQAARRGLPQLARDIGSEMKGLPGVVGSMVRSIHTQRCLHTAWNACIHLSINVWQSCKIGCAMPGAWHVSLMGTTRVRVTCFNSPCGLIMSRAFLIQCTSLKSRDDDSFWSFVLR